MLHIREKSMKKVLLFLTSILSTSGTFAHFEAKKIAIPKGIDFAQISLLQNQLASKKFSPVGSKTTGFFKSFLEIPKALLSNKTFVCSSLLLSPLLIRKISKTSQAKAIYNQKTFKYYISDPLYNFSQCAPCQTATLCYNKGASAASVLMQFFGITIAEGHIGQSVAFFGAISLLSGVYNSGSKLLDNSKTQHKKKLHLFNTYQLIGSMSFSSLESFGEELSALFFKVKNAPFREFLKSVGQIKQTFEKHQNNAMSKA
jgi:hypothetical protein